MESLTHELQQKKAARIAKSTAASTIDTASDAGLAPSTVAAAAVAPMREDDNQSLQSFASESFSVIPGRDAGEGGSAGPAEKVQRKSKLQLWDEIKISCLHSLDPHAMKALR